MLTPSKNVLYGNRLRLKKMGYSKEKAHIDVTISHAIQLTLKKKSAITVL